MLVFAMTIALTAQPGYHFGIVGRMALRKHH
jgi:hypothetical protein